MNPIYYMGILISDKTCHIPQSRFIKGINKLSRLIKMEKSVKAAMKQNKDLFIRSVMRPKELLICHIFHEGLSFSKLKDGALSELTDEDIFEILTNDPLHTLARDINKRVNAELNNKKKLHIKSKDLLKFNIIKAICDKDFSEENHYNIKGLGFIFGKEKINDNPRFEELIDKYSKEHDIQDMDDFLMNYIISCTEENSEENTITKNTNENNSSDDYPLD